MTDLDLLARVDHLQGLLTTAAHERAALLLALARRREVTEEMLARALRAYDEATGDPHEQADHESAMREAIAAALEVDL